MRCGFTVVPIWQETESTAERDRLIFANDKLQSGTDKLREAYHTAMETEAVGAQVMQDLHEQRETIGRSRGHLTKAGVGLARSRRVLAAMGRRALANKLLLWCMIVFLVVLFILLVYLELHGNSNAGASPPPSLPEMVEDPVER